MPARESLRPPSSRDVAGEDFLFHLYRGSELLQDNRVHDAKAELDYVLIHGPVSEAWFQKRDLPFVIISPQLDKFSRGQIPYIRDRTPAQIPKRLADGAPVGMCGLIKRDSLVDIDLGYAFLPAARGQGFAREAATAVLQWGWQALGLKRVVAIVTPTNSPSLKLLSSIGFGVSSRVDPVFLKSKRVATSRWAWSTRPSGSTRRICAYTRSSTAR